MPNNWKIVFSAASILAGVSIATAQTGGLPTIDIRKGCRAAEAELTALYGNGTTDAFKSCMDGEQEGHDQLVKAWGTYSALAKGKCIKPKEFLPSYVEWHTCLDMTQDVIKMRKAAAEAARQGPKSATSRQCPVVQIGEDGNIVSVIAC